MTTPPYRCDHCKNNPLKMGVTYPIYGFARFCSIKCKVDYLIDNCYDLGLNAHDMGVILRSLVPMIQVPLPFPPSALNSPKETLKIKVRQDISIATLTDEWVSWLTHEKQTVYNRVEFKYKSIYFVIAKLKPAAEGEEDSI